MDLIYPVRINKYLALKKLSTRRGADELIKEKKVFINGKLAELGSKVNEGDEVQIKNHTQREYKYFAYNKPIGVITHSPQGEEVSIKEDLLGKKIPKDVFPVGRLDKDSHGLIILTNDGRITDKLLSPAYYHEKEYLVKTTNRLRESFKDKMERGVRIDSLSAQAGYTTKPCKVQIINENLFKITLTEGKKHQIRRMCSALFQGIEDLKRTRVLNIKLGALGPGEYREIKGNELKIFLKQVLED
jgi:23S rRNA pseudouridine2604 synthase